MTLLYWIPKIFFVLLFIFIGYFGIRKKTISIRFIVWLFILYVLERIVEVLVRVQLSFSQTLAEGYTSVAYKFYQSTLLPNLQSILVREGVIIIIAVIVWTLLFLYAKKTNFQKLDTADVSIFAFGILVSGWPNFLLYLFIVFVLTLFGLLVSRIFKKIDTMIVTPYFAIAGIIIIFWGWKLSELTGLYAIR